MRGGVTCSSPLKQDTGTMLHLPTVAWSCVSHTGMLLMTGKQTLQESSLQIYQNTMGLYILDPKDLGQKEHLKTKPISF